MGHAEHDRVRPQPRTAAYRQVWPPTAFLGPAPAAPRPGHRPRGGAAIRPGTPPRARSDEGIRLRRRRPEPEGPVLVDLALAPGERRLGSPKGHRNYGRARSSRQVSPAATNDRRSVLKGKRVTV